ncbi:hypothetical protein COO60DRAFT_1637857 [Scenedesmus sp. NREL 46B-D3]|nr:hypothetical protein COO60DRAFT_1637857 [Scenedesmus sp. NREL 46B-D3]
MQQLLQCGHLEHGESFEQCAAREVVEETGIAISAVRFAAAENVVFPTGQHYVVIFMQGHADPGAEAEVKEPEKCKGWRWVDADPSTWQAMTIFRPLQQLVDHGFPQ